MAGKTFSIVFDASMNISQMTGAVKKIQSEFNKLQIGGSFQKKITSLLVELDSAIKDFETKSGKEITSKRDIGEIESATRKIVNLYERLKIEAKTLSSISNKELQKLFPEDLEKNFKQVETYLGKYKDLVEKNNKEIENKQRELKQAQEKLTKIQQKDAAKGKKKITAAEMRDLKNSQSQINKQRKKQQESIAQLEEEKNKRIESGSMRIKKDGTADKRYGDATENQDLLDRIQKAQIKLAELNESYNQVSNKISGSITETDYEENLKKIEKEIEEAQKAVTNFEKEIADLKANPQATESFETLRKEVEKLTGLDLSNITQDLDGFEKLKQIFDDFQTGKLEEARKKLEDLEGAVKDIAPAVGDTEGAVRKTGEAFSEMSRGAQDLARLQDQVLDFFSLSNTIQIFKNAVRDAFETVKELDAVMTETAVVTDFSIGDMWDKLPEYSKEANKLGTSIKSLYEATTLYYQQGLNSDQAMDVGIETMKMARIANMDAAAATEAMTAALRGFNMEINETNATRINDVYSELAAITAADTEQIATAMSKTASIADAANMEFETTAAFLAQIIETTQEAPETAGTAMKTIIARFTEVKELFDEGMLSGKDTEGEEININKIDAALKKVGISLNDFLKGEKGIDDIFLELASKWDTLDLATQRYIATTAAGSRQQSRFLAMMSNYDRTMELVTAANNSAGASQKQFDKTLESLEAKLQRLNNAWQEFTMGLANNEVIKAGVDLLTWFLETINKITGVAGNEGLGGVITMFARLATVIGALKGGGAIIKNLISGMAKTGVFSKNTLGNMGLDETGNWIKDISLMKILMNTLNVTTTESGVLFGKLGIEISKSATAFELAGAAGASSGAAVTIGWLPVVGIIAGIIVVVWALVAAFKAAHAASPEGKLEAASAAADGAAEAAEGAAQAYEHLAAALDSIGGKSAALENLAVGTTEWKNAVQELNGEVLDLVEQYPELAKFVDPSKGYLSFTDKEIDGKTVTDVLETYQDNKFKAQSASAAAKLQKRQAQIDLNYSKLDNDIKIIPKIDIPEYNPQYYSTQISQLQGGPYSAERAQKIAAVQKEWSEAEIAYNEAKLKEADGQFLPETRELTEKVAKAIASNQIEGISIDEKAKNKTIIVDGESYTFDDSKYDKLKEYGEGLLTADAATKVFTDSLLSNALMISDVSEDQKSNMMNFLNSEQIDNLVKNKKEEIAKGGISDEEKIKYAEAMGYEYINGKFYTGQGADQKEVAVSDDSIAAQLAGIQAQDDLTGRMEALNGVLGKIDETSESIPGIFERMTEKGEGAAITFKDIGEIQTALKNTGEGSELDSMYKEYGLEAVYGSYDEFISFLKNSAQLAENQYDKATENLTTVRMSDMIGFMERQKLDISQTKSISDLLYTSVLESGLDSGKELANQIKAGLEDQKYGDIFAEALSMIDIENIDSIRQLSEYLKELGYAGEIDIDSLEQQIISATNAAKNFNLDNLKEELKTVQDLVKDIKGREETERTYTEEEYNALVKGGASKDQFVMTGIDEFIYVGETNESLIGALQENTAALMGETQEQLRQAAEKSQTWVGLKEGTESQRGQYDLLKGIAEGSTNIKDVDLGEVETAMVAAGLLTSDLINQQGEFVDNAATLMLARIQTGYNTYGSDPAISGNLGAYENYMGSMPQMYYSQMTGQQILNAQGTFQPDGQNALGIEEDQAARTGALDAKLVQQEGGVGEYEYMLKNNEAWREHETLVKAAVVDANNYEKKLTKLADSIEENAEALSDSKKGTREYQKALNKVTEAAKDAFGDNITEDFVEDNLDLFKEFAKGSEDAVDGIRDKIFESFAASEKYTGDTLTAIQNATEEIDGSNFDIYGHADASQAFSELAELMGDAKAAADYLRSLGYSVTWEENGSTTMQMPDGSTREIPNYRAVVTDAAGNAAGARKGGGGGGGGGGSKWENPYDKLYNLTEKINQAIREREKLERRYDRLIERRQATAAELFENSQAEIESLEKQAELQQKMIDGRREMLQEEMDENKNLKKYATIDKETGEITINWDLINKVTNEKKGKEIEEYISKLEELRDSMHDAEDALEEIEDVIWENEERGREEYLEFEDRIKEALVEVFQKEIDELEEINETINDTNSKLIDSIQNSIDKMRQERENEETEQDLQEKQRRLAYLEQDTSGANAMEILDLREEIRQGQEDYTDTLIDQKISELQEQNDKAAEQREQQITLMQNQLKWYVESGRIWAEVETLMKEGLNPQGGLIRGSMLEQILQKGESWKALSEIGQMDWLLDLETMIAQSSEWRMKGGQLENLENKLTGQKIEFTNSKGEKLSGTVDDKGNVVLDDGTYYKNVYQWIDGTYNTTEEKATKPKTSGSSGSSSSSGSGKKKTSSSGPSSSSDYKYTATAEYRNYSFSAGTISSTKALTDGNSNDSLERATINAKANAETLEKISLAAAEAAKKAAAEKNHNRNNIEIARYATGGLADFTGPAWLDGTKSRPELVLNQRDTQNFIQLKDILSSIMSHNIPVTNTSTENNGDFSFDIDINVESLQSDYDVEQVASKVKSMIVDNARYRNNNTISLTR